MESTLQSQGNFLGESRTNFNTVSEILVGRFMTIQSTEEARFIYFVLFPWDPHHSALQWRGRWTTAAAAAAAEANGHKM